jgi:hypothetical protein
MYSLLKNINKLKRCKKCNREFNVDNDTSQLLLRNYAKYTSNLDYFYINAFSSICKNCIDEIIDKPKRQKDKYLNDTNDRDEELKRLYNLYELTGIIPNQNYYKVIYNIRNEENILDFLELIDKMWIPEKYSNNFDNFLIALIESGILPKGTRELPYGTQVLANDGDLCFSIPEKEIDDYLYKNNIEHKKEVSYPDSNLRADWEIFGYKSRIFIEYFGLMSKGRYRKKAKEKIKMAKKYNISLLELYPTDRLKHKIDCFLDNCNKNNT